MLFISSAVRVNKLAGTARLQPDLKRNALLFRRAPDRFIPTDVRWQTSSNLPEKLPQQHVEMVHAILPLYRIPPSVVRRGMQTLLHVGAQHDVFLLHFFAEGDGAGNAWKNHSKIVSVLSCERGTITFVEILSG